MNKADNARIINVSSNAHKLCEHLDISDLCFERDDSAKTFLKIYGVTKLCNILFTRELARRIQTAGKITFKILKLFNHTSGSKKPYTNNFLSLNKQARK